MLTPADLRAMTPEERTALFDQMATAYWGTASYGVLASNDLDVSRPTIFRWQSSNNVPFPVLYTLDAWLNSPAYAAKIFADLAAIPSNLNLAVQHLAQAGRTLATVAQRFPRLIQTELAVALPDNRSCLPEPQPAPASAPQSADPDLSGDQV